MRLVHVGRLDTDTEGLLLLSNDGELAHRLMHPGYEIPKTYVAIVKGRVEPWAARKLRRGIELEDGPARADRVTIKDSDPAGSIVEITLHSGRNQIGYGFFKGTSACLASMYAAGRHQELLALLLMQHHDLIFCWLLQNLLRV